MLRSTFIAFEVLSIALIMGAEARADIVTQLASPSALSAGDTTLNFPSVATSTVVGSPISFTAGTNTLTFSAAGGNFEEDTVGSTYFETAFANSTNILYAAGYAGPTAPITLTFANAVAEVGFNAEEFADGPYTMSVTAYDGATNLGTYTATGYDPALGEGGGVLSFEGLQDSGGGITSLVISDASGDNIALGPVTFGGTPSAVPEPASVILLFTVLLATALVTRKRIAQGL